MTIIKHSNGNYSVWSNGIDNFTHINITKEEFIIMRLEEYYKEILQQLERIDKGLISDMNYTPDERLKILEEVHGKERRIEVEKLLP